MAAPLITKRRVVAAKIESAPGTAVSLSATDAAMVCWDATAEPDIPIIARPGTAAALSPMAGVAGAAKGKIKFSTDAIGGVSAPLWASTLLAGCGIGLNTGVYSPDSRPPEVSNSTAKTLTIGVYEDGVVKKICGAMGNVKIFFKSGEPVRAEFEFTGVWIAPVDASILTPTFPTAKAPRFSGGTFTLASIAQKCTEITFDSGNTIEIRADGNSTNGLHSAIITARSAKITSDPEAALVATQDYHGLMLASTESAIALSAGSSGNRLQLAAPKAQVVKCSPADRSGIATNSIEFQLNRSVSAGDDEFSITID